MITGWSRFWNLCWIWILCNVWTSTLTICLNTWWRWVVMTCSTLWLCWASATMSHWWCKLILRRLSLLWDLSTMFIWWYILIRNRELILKFINILVNMILWLLHLFFKLLKFFLCKSYLLVKIDLLRFVSGLHVGDGWFKSLLSTLISLELCVKV